MKIQLRNRFTDKVMIEGEYESIRDLVQKNQGTNLWGADLRGAKIKITQKEDLIKSFGIIIEE